MPYKYKRVCPICQRPNVIHMSSHLAMVHELSATERSPYLKRAVLCPSEPITRPTLAKHKKHRIYPKQSRNSSIQLKPHGRNTNQSISSEAYEDFRFGHKFSLMVVGPSMSGKSFFVKQMLERDHIEYDDPQKQRRIHWFYGQYRDMFNDMRRNMGRDIYFKQGLPEFEPDLCDIDPRYNNIVVLDDLMDMAVDSPIISKLFTQGRHRNASVILLLQNAFPKGKYNTSISRNAQYMALFRCPADRRQMGIMADRIFDKNKPAFMEIYNDITSKAYSYVVVDNKADTPARRQIIVDIFGNCVSYNITGVGSAVPVTKRMTKAIDLNEESARTYNTEDDHSKILKRNDQKGPIIVRLDKREWTTVQEEFREAECGGNLPIGWVLWRIYAVDIPDYYKPVIIKKTDSEETKCYRVHDEWLFAFYPQYRTLL